jgi:hypothetical protein
MRDLRDTLASKLLSLEGELAKLRISCLAGPDDPIARWRSDAKALQFHLRDRGDHTAMLCVLGGTGTGKSTVVNRLAGMEASATSFRRTFTSGAVAVAANPTTIPPDWLSLPHRAVAPADLPARGTAGTLAVVPGRNSVASSVTIVDTPDLDGDHQAHHAEADRAFRWSHAVLFLVTPEKYQMTELLPYYRLARRYGMPALFLMNKCEEAAVLEDFRMQLAGRDWPEAALFAIPRDDAAYEPPPEASLNSLRSAIDALPRQLQENQETLRASAKLRAADLLGRLRDQVLAPLQEQRSEIDLACAALRAMTAPPPGIDLSPVTQQLQRRLQEQSVLYLMGPQRILDRVRQIPTLLLRLPRGAWDVLRGEPSTLTEPPQSPGSAKVPDFAAILADQFTILQSRIDDLLADSPSIQKILHSPAAASLRAARLSSADAAAIANDELAQLNQWLQQRWQSAPRDTRILEKVLKLLPGGQTLTRWSEAAPYLLAIVVATHHAFFGPVDLVILGSFSLATWLGEKLSNEVTARTRQANLRIADRFSRLAREQIKIVCDWLDEQAPEPSAIARVTRRADEISEDIA